MHGPPVTKMSNLQYNDIFQVYFSVQFVQIMKQTSDSCSSGQVDFKFAMNFEVHILSVKNTL